MITFAIIAFVLLLSGCVGLLLFFPLRKRYSKVEYGPDDSRKASITEITQVAFIDPYLIILVWVANGHQRGSALIVGALIVAVNIATIRALNKKGCNGSPGAVCHTSCSAMIRVSHKVRQPLAPVS